MVNVRHVRELQPRVPDVMTDFFLWMLALAQVNNNPAHDNKHRMYICDRKVVYTNIIYCLFILACDPSCDTCSDGSSCITCNDMVAPYHNTGGDGLCYGKDYVAPVICSLHAKLDRRKHIQVYLLLYGRRKTQLTL